MPAGVGYQPDILKAILATGQLSNDDIARRLAAMGAPTGATSFFNDLTNPLKNVSGLQRNIEEGVSTVGDLLRAIGQPSSLGAATSQGPVFGAAPPQTRSQAGVQFGQALADAGEEGIGNIAERTPARFGSEPTGLEIASQGVREGAGAVRDLIAERGASGVADPFDLVPAAKGVKATRSFIDMVENPPTARTPGRRLQARPRKTDNNNPIAQAVATRLPDGTILRGNPGDTHGDIRIRLEEQGRPEANDFDATVDGFIDPRGQFISRDEAIRRSGDPEGFDSETLRSEGLLVDPPAQRSDLAALGQVTVKGDGVTHPLESTGAIPATAITQVNLRDMTPDQALAVAREAPPSDTRQDGAIHWCASGRGHPREIAGAAG